MQPRSRAPEAPKPAAGDASTEATTPKPAAASSIFESLFPELADKPDLRQSPTITTTDSARPDVGFATTDPDMQPYQDRTSTPLSKPTPWTSGRTTLTLTSASASLAPSDFFRLAPAGAHLRGWRRGLAAVTQARHPATLEAQGTYHLTFDTAAAAAAYAAELARLHARWRHAVRARYHANPHRFRDGVRAPLLDAARGGDELARFAVLPPDARLEVRKLVEEEDGTSQVERLFGARPGGPAAAARALLVVDGYGLTLAGLRRLVAEDGAERNMAWGLVGDSHGVVSVQWLVSGRLEPEEDWRRRFRFVVSFAEAVEAHRFVRSWHRRSVQDPKNSRFVQVNASLIW